MILERWALPLKVAGGCVPKITQAAARTDLKCTTSEMCFYHLGQYAVCCGMGVLSFFIYQSSSIYL